MNPSIPDILRLAIALISGGVIGLAFGTLQKAALRRHEKLQRQGQLKHGWAVMPGSFRRVAYLMVALAAVQFLCPILFAPGTVSPWFVSAGVIVGYGWTLVQQLRRSLA